MTARTRRSSSACGIRPSLVKMLLTWDRAVLVAVGLQGGRGLKRGCGSDYRGRHRPPGAQVELAVERDRGVDQ